MERFVVSDTHFGHDNIIKYCNRPFSDADEMDEVMVSRWNSVVGPKDTVYHLGDVCMARRKLNQLSRLNGRIILLKGNHDVFHVDDYRKYVHDVRSYVVKRTIGGQSYVMSHIPVHPVELDRFKFNIHGHLHDKRVMVRDKADKRYVNVCVEWVNYTPQTLNSLEIALDNGVYPR